MTRTLSANMNTKIEGGALGPVMLVEIAFNGNTYRYNDTDADLTVVAQTWTAAPFRVDAMGHSKTQTISQINISIANADGAWGKLVTANDIRGSVLNVYMTELSLLTEKHLLYPGYIDSVSVNGEAMTVTVRSDRDWIGERLPRRTHAPRCPWVFKSTDCGYSGAETSCGKTISDCTARGQTANFGGFLPWSLK